MKAERARTLKEGRVGSGPVVYRMSRDQRVKGNWALTYSQDKAIEAGRPLLVMFCLSKSFLGAEMRNYDFMLRGLIETESSLRKKNIGFVLLTGEPSVEAERFIKHCDPAIVVCDFDPLRIKKKWTNDLCESAACSVFEVDTHNVVPCFHVSDKREYAAYTLRPKIEKSISEFLDSPRDVIDHPFKHERNYSKADWKSAMRSIEAKAGLPRIKWLAAGEAAAEKALRAFISHRLDGYAKLRNDPSIYGQSDLSPYIHFGQISAQRIAMEILQSDCDESSKADFLEELITRKELSDNFCHNESEYDNPKCVTGWAKITLNAHANDPRDYLYEIDDIESAQTHDELWNAAQKEMLYRGKMHGYMRMYWAKKIFEWTDSLQTAWSMAVYLNDRYELDGRDPNGYAQIAWCLGGVHDRAWGEREIFGKVRYMSRASMNRKFNTREYIERVEELERA